MLPKIVRPFCPNIETTPPSPPKLPTDVFVLFVPLDSRDPVVAILTIPAAEFNVIAPPLAALDADVEVFVPLAVTAAFI